MTAQRNDPGLRLPRTGGWQGLLLAPLFALAALSIGHALVTPSCAWQTTVALHVTFLVAALASGGAALLSLNAWRRAGGRAPLRDSGGDGGRPEARRLFVPLIGTAAGAFFTLVILAQWLAAWILSPCTY